MDAWMHEKMSECMCGCMPEWWVVGLVDVDGWMDGWVDAWVGFCQPDFDKPDKKTCKYIFVVCSPKFLFFVGGVLLCC